MKKFIIQFIWVTIAIAILSVAINMFLAPHQIAAGGVSGIGILMEKAFGFDRALTVFAINSVLLVFAIFFLGKEVFVKIFIGSNLLPIFLGIVPEIKVANDVLMSVVVGSVIFAIGVLILYHHDASSGGTTIPPMIFKKYFNINPSIGLALTDATIVIFNIFVFGFDSFLYAVLSIFITAAVMNYVETGVSRKKAVLIISDQEEAILQDVITYMQRGVTRIPAIGGYTKKENDMLLVVIDGRSFRDIKKIIDKHDRRAFVIASTVSDVHGLGFTYTTIA